MVFMADKKRKVYVEDDKGSLRKQKVDYGIFFGADDKDMKIGVVGESTFEEMNNLIMSGVKHVCETAVHSIGEEQRKEVYTRAVQMFSLVMDDFYPEGKDERFGMLTDEDIKEAEDRKIELLHKQKED